jgi:hypothetical protein
MADEQTNQPATDQTIKPASRFADFLKAAGDEASFDLFHVVISLVILVFLGLEVWNSASAGGKLDEGFATKAAILLAACAGTFPIRDIKAGSGK